MVNYREILRLHSQDYSQRQIANSVGSSRNTVSDVLLTAQKLQLTVGDCEIMSDEALLAVFHPEKLAGKSDRKEPDYEYIHGELAKEGVTLTLLDAMTRGLLKMTETIVQLRSKLSAAGMFPVQELHSDLSCVYSDFKVWNDFVEVYFDGTDPFVGE